MDTNIKMSCFPCFLNCANPNSDDKRDDDTPPHAQQVLERNMPEADNNMGNVDSTNDVDTGNGNAQQFTFRELAKATNNFRRQFLLGEGGFGRVYKGTIKSTGQDVAVKQLDKNGVQQQKEFIVEVLMLTLLRHKNLAHLFGYCADGDQRLLVYEFVPGGTLDERIHVGPEKEPLDWYTRIEIAYGVAQGLEYLHDKANPPVIYRDLKSSNILLDKDLSPKLSDFGLANLGTKGMNRMPSSSIITGTFGYGAPEYTTMGQVTMKSDVFSYGVVLLEIITGRRAIDTTRPNNEQNLVSWAQQFFKDPKRFPELADPLLEGKFPERSLNQVVAIAAMCLQEEPGARPFMSDVVTTLSFLSKDKEATQGLSPTADPATHESSDSDDDKMKETSTLLHCSGISYSREATTMRSRRCAVVHDVSDTDDVSDDHESPN